MIIGVRPITDHGGFGASLLDDDHPQYFKADGSRNLTGNLVTSGQGIRPAANSTTAIQVQQADGTAFVDFDSTNKFLGINTTPVSRFTVLETDTAATRGVVLWQIQSTAGNLFNFRKSRGTQASPLIVGNGDLVATIQSQVFSNGSTYFATAGFGWKINGTVTTSSIPTDMFFNTGAVDNTNMSLNPALYITSTKYIGISTSSPTKDLSFSGQAARTIWLERHTTAATPGNNLTIQAGAPKAGESNLAGGTLYLSGAISTGTGKSAVELQTATAGVSGSADNTPTTKFKIDGNSIAFFGGTPAAQQTLIAYTSDAESGAYTGIDNLQAGSVYAAVADLNVLRTAYDNLRASYDDLRTKLLATTLVLSA